MSKTPVKNITLDTVKWAVSKQLVRNFHDLTVDFDTKTALFYIVVDDSGNRRVFTNKELLEQWAIDNGRL